MKLLLLNDTFFGPAFKRLGVDVLTVGLSPSADYQIKSDGASVYEILKKANFNPDVVLQIDSINRRFIFNGLENIKCPSAFYAIDGPINNFWQRSFAHGFDRIYIDQQKTWRTMTEEGIEWCRWLPLSADIEIFNNKSDKERDIDLLFIGTLDGNLRPKRSAIIHRLRQVANIKVIDGGGTRNEGQGTVADYYRRAKIVLNENLFDGITSEPLRRWPVVQ